MLSLIRVVSYNDSLLTHHLRDVFGGTCVTVVFCCVSPSTLDSDETLNTLKFASWVAKIKNRPVPNVHVMKDTFLSNHSEILLWHL